MLKFYSGNIRIANTERAVKGCLDMAFEGQIPDDLQAIIVYSTLGHKLDKVYEQLNKQFPDITIMGASCGGVIGKTGPGESMNDLAIMAVSGPDNEIALGFIDEVSDESSFDKIKSLSESLDVDHDKTRAVMITIPGFQCAMDGVVDGFREVFSDEVHLTGGVSSDNMKNITSYQSYNDNFSEHMIWAIAFADSTLECVSRATHGFDAIGEPMHVTKADSVEIVEIDDRTAAEAYGAQFKITEESLANDMMPFGALGEEISEDKWNEYGSKYRLNGLAGVDGGRLHYRTRFKEGTVLRFAVRNEERIFAEMERIMDEIREDIQGEILAVSHSDCVARGRYSLDAIKKDELINMMQEPLSSDGVVPPWLGMYGFGEFCQLGGENMHHTFTTSLTVIYRKK